MDGPNQLELLAVLVAGVRWLYQLGYCVSQNAQRAGDSKEKVRVLFELVELGAISGDEL
jgi:hypothetical protein